MTWIQIENKLYDITIIMVWNIYGGGALIELIQDNECQLPRRIDIENKIYDIGKQHLYLFDSQMHIDI